MLAGNASSTFASVAHLPFESEDEDVGLDNVSSDSDGSSPDLDGLAGSSTFDRK